MKTIDLRTEQIDLDGLLRSVGGESVRITSKDGGEFVLEAAEASEREREELGRSAKFLAFLSERSQEPGRISLSEIESRLSGGEPGGRPDGVDS